MHPFSSSSRWSLALIATLSLISCVPEHSNGSPPDESGDEGSVTQPVTGGGAGSVATGGGVGLATGGGVAQTTGGGGGGAVAAAGGSGGSEPTGGSGGGGEVTGSGGGAATGGGGGITGTGGFALGPTGCVAETLDANVSVGGYMSDRYGWSDGNCQRRTAALVRNNAADPGGSRGGYLRELTLTVNGATRTARGTGSNGWNGWGYVVNHYASSADTSKSKTGTFRTVLAGAHHAIHEFKVQMNPGGPVTATIHWFFATGRSEPIYGITFDVAAAANAVNADTRAPYGDLAFEGTPGPIGGIGWGDIYKFTTTGNGPVTQGTPWDYTAANKVPYVRMWSSAVDAEMGAVQTQTFAQHAGGGDYGGIGACQGKTSSTRGSGCSSSGQTMPADWTWPFQLNQYELPFVNSSHRLAWGSNYGAIGRSSGTTFGKSFSGHPQVKYGVFMVVGAHSTNDTLARVTQVERLAAATVTGGTWNALYAVWEAPHVQSGTTLTLDPQGEEIAAPIFRLMNFTATTPTEVKVDGVLLQPGVGYFATVDAVTQTLWLTLNGKVSAPITLQVR